MSHAALSPSGAHRWMACPGSAALESASPRTSSVYADEGTAAHLLATMVLTGSCPASDFIGEEIRVGERRFPVTKDMADYVQSYCDYVFAKAEGCVLLVEQRVPIGHITGERGAKGTADVVIICAVQRHLIMIDFKYGQGVKVFAPGNPQTRLYGLGTLYKYEDLADFDTVEMTIHQPRLDHVSSETLTVDELVAFGREATAAAEEATGAMALWAAGATAQEFMDGGYLHPEEDACRFCDAKHTCPALRQVVIDQATGTPASKAAFASLLPIVPDAELPTDVLDISMEKVGLIEDWCKGIRAECERRLLIGQAVPGWKLVTGKQGDRKWTGEDDAIKAMKQKGLKAADIYDKKLISPTTAEKLFKTNPEAWKEMQAVITRAPGKPSVAPATDPRPALAIPKVAEEFRAIANTE